MTLKVAIGPKRRVMGVPNAPTRGIVVLSIRLTPAGAFRKLFAKGL